MGNVAFTRMPDPGRGNRGRWRAADATVPGGDARFDNPAAPDRGRHDTEGTRRGSQDEHRRGARSRAGPDGPSAYRHHAPSGRRPGAGRAGDGEPAGRGAQVVALRACGAPPRPRGLGRAADQRAGPADRLAGRAVLGLLALHANTAVHRDVLIDALWADEPPDTAVAMVQSYVSRLRRLLTMAQAGESRGKSLITSGTSYQLCVTAGELDQIEFARRAAHAHEAHAAGEVGAACELYARALSLWRGEPLADVKVLACHPAV